jgi:hypothetical protein
MRKWLYILPVVLLLLLHCGGEETTNLQVRWVLQPVGGNNVTTVTATFEGRLSGGDEPITADVEWWWEDTGYSPQVIWSDDWVFADEEWEDVTAWFTAAPGMVLVGEFWVRVSWEDSEGGDHYSTSNHCYCTANDRGNGKWEIPQ